MFQRDYKAISQAFTFTAVIWDGRARQGTAGSGRYDSAGWGRAEQELEGKGRKSDAATSSTFIFTPVIWRGRLGGGWQGSTKQGWQYKAKTNGKTEQLSRAGSGVVGRAVQSRGRKGVISMTKHNRGMT